ncbi:hypothetical protein HDZ31DRAFT_36759 [Schizophyllum fasciatum]
MLPTLFAVSAALLAGLARSAPYSKPHELVVWRPKITYPVDAIDWQVGEPANVTWDTSDMPPNVTNLNGTILLGHPDEQSEHLNSSHPLAQGFSLKDGVVYFVVPEVEERWDYVVALVGDSGNLSPTFHIYNPADDADADPFEDTEYEE